MYHTLEIIVCSITGAKKQPYTGAKCRAFAGKRASHSLWLAGRLNWRGSKKERAGTGRGSWKESLNQMGVPI